MDTPTGGKEGGMEVHERKLKILKKKSEVRRRMLNKEVIVVLITM